MSKTNRNPQIARNADDDVMRFYKTNVWKLRSSVVFTMLCLFVLCVLIGQTVSSAIPMWEFLSKQEKTSYLYSMFANQVEEYCGKSTMANCNRELLKYGLNKLKDMPEDHLDEMDPYQHGANDIIWNSMMEGHEMMKTSPKPKRTTTAKPNSYEDESFSDFGFQGAASARIDHVYQPPKNFYIRSGIPLYYPYNFNSDKPEVYSRFLTGPMVVRVYPDGRPVQEPNQQLPQDEDLRQYYLSKVKIPDF